MAARDLYSRADLTRTADDGELDEWPTFDLEAHLSRRKDEVTICPRKPSVAIFTEWITIDPDHAIPLEEVA